VERGSNLVVLAEPHRLSARELVAELVQPLATLVLLEVVELLQA
jgi:hypothetical protein